MDKPSIYLTAHFSLTELVASQTAARRKLKNVPDKDAIENLRLVCADLEVIRHKLDSPILITSGYRSAAVNEAVGGKANSKHQTGHAVDFVAPRYGEIDVVFDRLAVLIYNDTRLHCDKLILEYGEWIHYRLPTEGREPRRLAMKIT